MANTTDPCPIVPAKLDEAGAIVFLAHATLRLAPHWPVATTLFLLLIAYPTFCVLGAAAIRNCVRTCHKADDALKRPAVPPRRRTFPTHERSESTIELDDMREVSTSGQPSQSLLQSVVLSDQDSSDSADYVVEHMDSPTPAALAAPARATGLVLPRKRRLAGFHRSTSVDNLTPPLQQQRK